MTEPQRQPVTNIIFGTMTLGYAGYGARVNDPETALRMIDLYAGFGHRQLDTARAYGDGSCEQMLGDLGVPDRFEIATRFDPEQGNHAHEPDTLKAAFRSSLARLRTGKVKILYLTMRDSATPLEHTLRGVQDLYEEGLFEEFGLSNFSTQDVQEVVDTASRNGWVRPAVYQGLYNAITRAVEAELFPVLRANRMRFHAYNPLAGGAFSPSFGREKDVTPGSRFDPELQQGKVYRDRYWNDSYLTALRDLHRACGEAGVDPVSAALRWLVHHSQLSADHADGVIVGASSLKHLEQNLQALRAGPLGSEVLRAIHAASETARPGWPPYHLTC